MRSYLSFARLVSSVSIFPVKFYILWSEGTIPGKIGLFNRLYNFHIDIFIDNVLLFPEKKL